MSISQHTKQHGKKNSSNKRSQTISTATTTVSPTATAQTSIQNPHVASSAVDSLALSIRGQCVRGVRVVEQTVMASVAELVGEVIPQSAVVQQCAQNEPICWVKIQRCPHENGTTTLAVIIGLAKGYQIWMMLERGEFEEVVSERKGPLRLGHLLPFSVESPNDRFRERRPLFALVEQLDNKCRDLTILSLKSGKTVHTLSYNEVVQDVESSQRVLLTILESKVIVHDQGTLTELHFISNQGSSPWCIALADNFVAFADENLNPSLQSCGGAAQEEELLCGQLITAAKSISKTISDSLSHSLVSSFSNQKSQPWIKYSNAGIVTIIDTLSLAVEANRHATTPQKPAVNVVAHFVAHANSHIGSLAYGSGGGRLLLAGSKDATTFYLFLIHPHPLCSRLSAVQHLYTLVRGTFSSARVVHCTFAADDRWLALSTNHGTTHLFPITPYGGPITSRTHCERFPNRESRFEKTIGSTLHQLPAEQHSAKGGARSEGMDSAGSELAPFKAHPSSLTNAVISRSSLNPRLTTNYPPPIVLNSAEKIKQGAYTAENLSAWVGDNTPIMAGNPQCQHPHHSYYQQHRYRNGVNGWVPNPNRRLATAFIHSLPQLTNTSSLALFSITNEGLLTEYKVTATPIRERTAPSGNGTSDTITSSSNSNPHPTHSSVINTSGKVSLPDAPVKINAAAILQWTLSRNRGNSVEIVDPPLSPSNPLIRSCAPNLGAPAGQKSVHPPSSSSSWIPNVEASTYSGPYRRLWMGPQFIFSVYTHSEHASAQLISLNDAPGRSHFPVGQKCCPVLIEKSVHLGIPIHDASAAENAATKIICGSWSSDYGYIPASLGGGGGAIDISAYAAVKDKIADAMRESENATKKVETKLPNGISKVKAEHPKYGGM